jgi:anti-sigma factor RsiW
MAATLLLGGALGAALTARWQQPASAALPASNTGWLQRAALAHSVYVPEVRHPVEISIASAGGAEQHEQQEHLAGWLTKRLSVPVKLFDLQAEGFELLGGRLLPDTDDAGRAAAGAQLMYQGPGGTERVTVYLRKPETGTPTEFRYAQQGELGLFYWIEGMPGRAMGYALVGALPKERLLELATAIARQGEPGK